MRVLAVVQARTGSSRFPGKVLADLGGRPMLAFMLERLQGLKVDQFVVATTTMARDDAVVAVADAAGVPVVRGPEDDVLARFAIVLDAHPAEVVVRLTGDCPLVDPRVAEQVIELHRQRAVDYASNTLVRTFPDGLDVEVVTAEALRNAAGEATDAVEREHVTPFIYRRPGRFTLAAYRQAPSFGHERWTVDTAEDLDVVRRAIGELGGRADAGWREILAVMGSRSSIASPIHPTLAADVDAVAATTQFAQALRSGAAAKDAAEFLRRITRSIDDPSVRAWSVVEDEQVTGCLVVTAADGVGELSAVVKVRSAALLDAAVKALMRDLLADHQVHTVTADDVAAPISEVLERLAFGRDNTGTLVWRRT